MSGFDNILQTQQLTEGWRNDAADYANDRMIESSQTALGVVRDIRDHQLKATESLARMQMWETENQINQQKLAQLQALDMTEMGRLEVMNKHQATQQNALAIEAGRFALEQEKKKASALSDDQQKEAVLSQWETQVMGKTPLDRALNGWVNKDGRWVRSSSKDDRDRAISQAREDMKLAKGGASNRDWDRELMLREIGQIQDLLSSSSTNFDAAYSKKMRERLTTLQGEYDKRYRSGGSGQADPQGQADPDQAGGSDQKSQRIDVTALPLEVRTKLGNAIKSSIPWDEPKLAPLGKEAATQEVIEELMVQFLTSKPRYTPEQAAQIIGQQMTTNQALMADVLRRSGYSMEQVRDYMDIVWGGTNKGKNETFLKRMYEGEGR